MFNGIHKDINLALKRASDLAIDESGKIEIELRLYSFGSLRKEGVGDVDAFLRAERAMFKLEEQKNSGWTIPKDERRDPITQKDTIVEYTENYRSIETLGGNKVFQKKIKDSPEGINVKEYRGKFSVAVEGLPGDKPQGEISPQKDSRRQRERLSFLYAPGGDRTNAIQVDFTEVTSEIDGKDNKYYQVEIEAIGHFPPIEEDDDGNLILNPVQAKMDEIATLLYRYIYETPLIYSKEIRASLIGAINAQAVKQKGTLETGHILGSWINQPRPIERRDLVTGTMASMFPAKPEDGPVYSVTIKTDGRRVLACWHETGLYLCGPFAGVISRIMKWKPVGGAGSSTSPTPESPEGSPTSPIPESPEEELGSDLIGTILDCELIEEGYITEQTNFSLYVFDCMFVRVQGQIVDIREKPLSTRLSMARFVAKKFNEFIVGREDKMVVNFAVKKFIPFVDRASFYEANKTALKLNMRDGREMYKSDGLVFTDLGPYLRDERAVCDCGKRCDKCSSFNATRNLKFKEVRNLTIDFLIKADAKSRKTINTTDNGEKFRRNGYRPFTGDERFPIEATQFLDAVDVNGKMEPLEEGQIIEMKWDKDPNDGQFKWIPVKVRNDRTSANKTNVAMTNWNLIYDPIPLGVLKGELKGRKVLQFMRQYHNRIKSEVLTYYNNEILARFQREGKITDSTTNGRRPVLFDIGSGSGGDARKWAATSFEVVALEPDADVINQKDTGLIARVIAAGISGRVNILNLKVQDTKTVVSKMHLLPTLQEADLVTSFFSMTLIMESAESVQQFVNTVKSVIAPNGVFVCTALDGKLVNRLLGDNKQLSVEGIKIQRKTKKNEIMIRFPAADQRIARGQSEFLVDFDFLITLMEAAGFELIKDLYLDSEVILNNSELFYSQLNRIIEMRYIGFKKETKRSERLDELKKIMDAAKEKDKLLAHRVPLPKVDEFVQINPQLCMQLNSNSTKLLDRTWWVTVGVLGGGSCFLHAILWCIYMPYREMTNDQRYEKVIRLRLELANNFTPAVYEGINNGNLKSFGDNAGSVYSYQSLREGLSDYTNWFGLEFLTFVQDQLNVNIHILWIDQGMLQFYRFAPDMAVTFRSKRNNILLFWEGRNHFQPVGRGLSGTQEASFVFESSDKLIPKADK